MSIDKEAVRNEMNLYRAGLGSIPLDYIKIHEECAKENINMLTERGFIILDTKMVSDGWGDGMKVMQVETINIAGLSKTFVWTDSNGGMWFEKYITGGSGYFAKPENNVGRL